MKNSLCFFRYCLNSLRNVRYLLLAILVGCAAIHFTLIGRTDSSNLLGTSLLFWSGIASCLWEKRYSIKTESNWFSSLIGCFVIGLVLFKGLAITGDHYLRVFPFILGIGLVLLASGFGGFRQYWQELTLTFFLGVPEVLLDSFVDLSELTARFSTLLLWFLGFDVYRQGVNIYLPGGNIKVYSGCSGLTLITQLIGISVIFLVVFNTKWRLPKQLLVVVFSATIAFCVNGIRVSLMTILVASENLEAFDYWHIGQGSLIFSLLAVLLFLGLCWILNFKPDIDSF